MPDNYSGLNIATQQGEGAANVLTWNNLDKAAYQIQKNQQIREQQGYDDYMATQAALQKELGNVRSADANDIMSAYEKQKLLKQQLLFDTKIKNNPKLYAQKAQEAKLAQAEFMQKVNASKELGSRFKQLPQTYANSPSKFEDNAGALMREDILKPTSQLNSEGWNEDKYLYKGSNYNLTSLLKDGMGALQTKYSPARRNDKEMQMEQDEYKVYNDPETFHAITMNSLLKRDAEKAASFAWNNLSPEQISTVNAAYEALPDSAFSGWGLNKKPVIPSTPFESDAQKYADYLTKLYTLQHLPTNPVTKVQPLYKERKDYGFGQTMQIVAANKSGKNDNTNLPEGNELDRIGEIESLQGKQTGLTVKDGVARTKDGNLYNGTVVIKGKEIPAGLKTVLKAGGFDFTDYNESFFDVKFKDGKPEALKNSYGSWITRQDIENYQLKANTESKKSRQPVYGNTSVNKPKQETNTNNVVIEDLPANNGKVDKAHLKVGKIYKYNAKNYKWDGNKLIPQ